MTQSRERAEALMEQQHYGSMFLEDEVERHAYAAEYEVESLTDDDNDDDFPNEDECADECATCGHMRESHVEFANECCECECVEFKEPE